MLKEIRICNFGIFNGLHTIVLAEPPRPHTVIASPGGAGKTTIAHAVLWCLTGNTLSRQKDILNMFCREKMANNSSEKVEVELIFDINGKNAAAKRSATFLKRDSNIYIEPETYLTSDVLMACEQEIEGIEKSLFLWNEDLRFSRHQWQDFVFKHKELINQIPEIEALAAEIFLKWIHDFDLTNKTKSSYNFFHTIRLLTDLSLVFALRKVCLQENHIVRHLPIIIDCLWFEHPFLVDILPVEKMLSQIDQQQVLLLIHEHDYYEFGMKNIERVGRSYHLSPTRDRDNVIWKDIT